jgi:hypothetical protein
MRILRTVAIQSSILAILFFCLSQGGVRLRAQVSGGMVNPDIDVPGEPFSYFWHPTDVIGALYAPVASEVTPEGYLYTGFGELMFFVGNPPEAVNQRVKTLYKDYLPVVEYTQRREGVRYRFRMFGADLGGGLKGLPVNFVQVEVHNESHEQRAAFLSSAYRFMPPDNGLGGVGDYRFRQRFDLIPKQYTDGQTAFNPDWNYALSEDALVRDGRILYLYATTPEPEQRTLSLKDNGFRLYRYFTGEVEGKSHPRYQLDPHTPMGVVTYRIVLQPGEQRNLVFKMPIVPIPGNSAEARLVRSANYTKQFDSTVSGWQSLVAQSPLRFPERKVQDYLLANTIFDLLAIDKVNGDYIPNVNKFQYHRYYGAANTANMLVAFDYMGLHEVAERSLLYAHKVQLPDGSFKMSFLPSAYPYWELFGYNLWQWGRHYELTHDAAFLRTIYSGVQRAVEWERKMTRQDPLGLMLVTHVADDAWLKGSHQTGQNMWVLIGLRNAIRMAEAMGKEEDAEHFKAEYERFWNAFEKQLSKQTAKSGGYIPPSLDRTLLGNNWDNLLTLYPEPLFAPFDPRVTATIQASRKTYSEGVLGYILPRAVAKEDGHYIFDSTPRLHYWQDPDNSENELVRDDPQDQKLAVEDLYALLLHTTSTHAPQEYGTYPWSTRDYGGGDILPDGASSGKTIELMRNMLVREYKDDLYLFSAISPAWVEPGKSVGVVDEPTVFGPVTAMLKAHPRGWEIKLSNRFWTKPAHLLIPIPWFYEAQKVEVDGQMSNPADGKLVISPSAHKVEIIGRTKPGAVGLSFEALVAKYQQEYKRKYEEFLKTGVVQP